MKLLTLLLLLSCGQVVAQKKDTTKLVAKESPFTGIGFFDKFAEVTVWDNGTIEIKGDSIRAIKMLWDKLREAHNREIELENKLSQTQKKLIQTYKDWMKSNDENIKMVERQFDKLKEKTTKQ